MLIKEKIIYQVLYGSDAYGTTTNDSDNDIRGIFLPTKEQMLGFYPPECHDWMDESGDYVFFSLKKFFSLAVKSNPAVFEWLFVPENLIQKMTEEGEMLRKNRGLFLSQEVYYRFKGFAFQEFSSLTKLTGQSGEKRKKQIIELGYSPKNAMNVIRLMEQGIELLETGNLTMPRPNADELRAIKLGQLKYNDVVKRFYELLTHLDSAKEHSNLPLKPQLKEAEELMIKIYG